ncbi:toxin-antitoxin system HicB family antitoxin [Herbiconiux sp. 11R-BC]|uniref:toxin-antitoxin system HicB family antitoxin n=1 Tax=Herbiconiux sp. 11R-BC TaxID=3111637 RepID=UPI003C125530
MELERYVIELRRQLASAASGAGAEARAIAEQLSLSLDAATRLVLLEALSDAAGEITREIAPGSVEVRLRGRDPEFAISVPAQPAFVERSATAEAETQRAGAEGETAPLASVEAQGESRDDTSTSRTTLRLPDQLKARVEKAAANDGLSLNTWLVRAIAGSLEPKSRRAAQRESRTNNTFTGWAR